MEDIEQDTISAAEKKGFLHTIMQRPARNMFWAWIAYQTIKGTLTTTFIWAPLLYFWLFHH